MRIISTLVGLLLLVYSGSGVTLAWDPSPDKEVSGYAIHYGTSRSNYTVKVDVGLVTSATITNLTGGVTYFFVATAYTTNGLESLPSNEVSYSVPLAVPYEVGITNAEDPSNAREPDDRTTPTQSAREER